MLCMELGAPCNYRVWEEEMKRQISCLMYRGGRLWLFSGSQCSFVDSLWSYVDVKWSFVVICGRLLVNCGRLWLFAGRLWSFVVAACFGNYDHRI